MAEKPRIVIQAEIILVGVAITAVGQFVHGAVTEYVECGPEEQSIVGVLMGYACALFFKIFGLFVFAQALPKVFETLYERLSDLQKRLIVYGLFVVLFFTVIPMIEVLEWSYFRSDGIDICTGNQP